MDQHQLFALALGLTEPWYVASLDFSAEDKRLYLDLHASRRRLTERLHPARTAAVMRRKVYTSSRRGSRG